VILPKAMGSTSIKDVSKKAAYFLGPTQPSLRENWMSRKHGVKLWHCKQDWRGSSLKERSGLGLQCSHIGELSAKLLSWRKK